MFVLIYAPRTVHPDYQPVLRLSAPTDEYDLPVLSPNLEFVAVQYRCRCCQVSRRHLVVEPHLATGVMNYNATLDCALGQRPIALQNQVGG